VKARSSWLASHSRLPIVTSFFVDEMPFSTLFIVPMPSFILMDSENLLFFFSQPKVIPTLGFTK
jgi:hypothetical protein